MSNDVKAYHQYETPVKETYDAVVKKWRETTREMLADTDETRIQRWSYSNGMYRYFNNPGKAITDDNPYINMIDLEEFEAFVKNQPTPADPPAFNNKNRPNFFGTMMDDFVDEAQSYKHHLHSSFERIMREAKGTDVPPPSKERQPDLVKLKSDIITYAKSLGFVSIGVTKIDRRYVAIDVDDALIFDTMIIMGYEMPKEVVQRYPNPQHDTAAYYGYSHCARYVHDVADYIRSQGYDCRARDWEGFIKYSVHAVNAGMGNFSTYGICHTPEVGTRLKYCSVIIDAPLALDSPKDWNIEEFCARCRMCQKSCPSGAIPKEERRYMGSVRRVTDHIKCFDAMATMHECVRCIRICPISMMGYEHAMETLPQYYQFNPKRDEMALGVLRQKADGKLEKKLDGKSERMSDGKGDGA